MYGFERAIYRYRKMYEDTGRREEKREGKNFDNKLNQRGYIRLKISRTDRLLLSQPGLVVIGTVMGTSGHGGGEEIDLLLGHTGNLEVSGSDEVATTSDGREGLLEGIDGRGVLSDGGHVGDILIEVDDISAARNLLEDLLRLLVRTVEVEGDETETREDRLELKTREGAVIVDIEVLEGLLELLELLGRDTRRGLGSGDLGLEGRDGLGEGTLGLLVLELEIVVGVVGVLVLINVASLASLLSLLDGGELGSNAIKLLVVGLVARELRLEVSELLSEDGAEGRDLIVESVGGLGEGLTDGVKDITEVGRQSGGASALGGLELLEVTLNITKSETLRGDVGGTLHSAELSLDLSEETLQIGLLSGPLTLLGLLVVTELRLKGLGSLVVVGKAGRLKLISLSEDVTIQFASAALIVVDQVRQLLQVINELGDTATSRLGLIEGREDLVELGNIGHDRTLIRTGHGDDILNIQKTGNVEMIGSSLEGLVEVTSLILRVQRIEVDQVGTMTMDDSAEGQTILERSREVLDVDILVSLGLTLAPQEQTFLGRETLLRETRDDETKNQTPDHTESHLSVSVIDLQRKTKQITVAETIKFMNKAK